MSDYTTLAMRIEESGIARLTLNRPKKHNSINSDMIAELRLSLSTLRENENVRVVILSGAGASFCAGADLNWMRQQLNNSSQGRYQEALNFALMLEDLNTLNKLVIARVNGAAYGGGIGLICACDIAIAHDQAQFCLSETKLGLVPVTITPFVGKRIGEAHMRRLALNARPFSAEEALRYDLLSQMTDTNKLDECIEQEIELVMKCAPGAVANTKSWIYKMAGCSEMPNAEILAQQLVTCWEQAEAQEGVLSFLNKSKSSWSKKK